MVLMLVLLHMFSIYATKLKFTAAQGRRVEFKSVGLVPEGVVGYAVVLTKKIVLVLMDNCILIYYKAKLSNTRYSSFSFTFAFFGSASSYLSGKMSIFKTVLFAQ